MSTTIIPTTYFPSCGGCTGGCPMCRPEVYAPLPHITPPPTTVRINITTAQPFKCPVCDGYGTRVQSSFVPYTCNLLSQSCAACKGTGIVWGPQ